MTEQENLSAQGQPPACQFFASSKKSTQKMENAESELRDTLNWKHYLPVNFVMPVVKICFKVLNFGKSQVK